MQKVYQISINGILVTDDSEGNPENWSVEDLIESLAGYPDVEVHEMALVRRVAEPCPECGAETEATGPGGEYRLCPVCRWDGSPDPDEEPVVEPKARKGTGSNIKIRNWRYREDMWKEKEYIYRGSDYARHAARLGLGTHDKETRVVWLTAEEIPVVREAAYQARLDKGLTTGVPRSRLNGVGGA
jgi:hypothetical protein